MFSRLLWFLLATLPVIGLVTYEALQLLGSYNGRCGLLDAGWDCTKSEYVSSTMLSPFFLPWLLFFSGCWLIVLASVALLFHFIHRHKSSE